MISQNGFKFIRDAEGLILHPYLDSAGVPTIGYGSTRHMNGDKVKMSDSPITEREAEVLLQWEVKNKASVVFGLLDNVFLNQNQKDALVSLAYNIGISAFANSTVLKRVRINPNDPTIKDAFLMWDKITVGGKKIVSEGLLSRRKKESNLYFTEVSPKLTK